MFTWEITIKHAAASAQDQAVYKDQIGALLQQLQAAGLKTTPAYGSRFEHRHAFQQCLIEEQRQQLQRQQKLILELQQNQRLSRIEEEAAQATAVTPLQQPDNSASQTREEKPERENQPKCENTTYLRYMLLIKQVQLVSMSHSCSS